MTKVFMHIESGEIFLEYTKHISSIYCFVEDADGFLFFYRPDEVFEIGDF